MRYQFLFRYVILPVLITRLVCTIGMAIYDFRKKSEKHSPHGRFVAETDHDGSSRIVFDASAE